MIGSRRCSRCFVRFGVEWSPDLDEISGGVYLGGVGGEDPRYWLCYSCAGIDP